MTTTDAEVLDQVRALVLAATDRVLSQGWDADLLLAAELQRLDEALAVAGAGLDAGHIADAGARSAASVRGLLVEAEDVLDGLDPATVAPPVLVARSRLRAAVLSTSVA